MGFFRRDRAAYIVTVAVGVLCLKLCGIFFAVADGEKQGVLDGFQGSSGDGSFFVKPLQAYIAKHHDETEEKEEVVAIMGDFQAAWEKQPRAVEDAWEAFVAGVDYASEGWHAVRSAGAILQLVSATDCSADELEQYASDALIGEDEFDKYKLDYDTYHLWYALSITMGVCGGLFILTAAGVFVWKNWESDSGPTGKSVRAGKSATPEARRSDVEAGNPGFVGANNPFSDRDHNHV